MKTITVGYWHSVIPEAGYKHNEEFPYSTRKQNSIVNKLLSKGLSVMLRPDELNNRIVIWIDKGRFGQR